MYLAYHRNCSLNRVKWYRCDGGQASRAGRHLKQPTAKSEFEPVRDKGFQK
jgi:hypothetical protein